MSQQQILTHLYHLFDEVKADMNKSHILLFDEDDTFDEGSFSGCVVSMWWSWLTGVNVLIDNLGVMSTDREYIRLNKYSKYTFGSCLPSTEIVLTEIIKFCDVKTREVLCKILTDSKNTPLGAATREVKDGNDIKIYGIGIIKDAVVYSLKNDDEITQREFLPAKLPLNKSLVFSSDTKPTELDTRGFVDFNDNDYGSNLEMLIPETHIPETRHNDHKKIREILKDEYSNIVKCIRGISNGNGVTGSHAARTPEDGCAYPEGCVIMPDVWICCDKAGSQPAVSAKPGSAKPWSDGYKIFIEFSAETGLEVNVFSDSKIITTINTIGYKTTELGNTVDYCTSIQEELVYHTKCLFENKMSEIIKDITNKVQLKSWLSKGETGNVGQFKWEINYGSTDDDNSDGDDSSSDDEYMLNFFRNKCFSLNVGYIGDESPFFKFNERRVVNKSPVNFRILDFQAITVILEEFSSAKEQFMTGLCILKILETHLEKKKKIYKVLENGVEIEARGGKLSVDLNGRTLTLDASGLHDVNTHSHQVLDTVLKSWSSTTECTIC